MAIDPNYSGIPIGTEGDMPQQLINGPQNFVYVQDPLTELAQCSGAIIRQNIEPINNGCQFKNSYDIFILSPMGLKYAFKCSENVGFCEKACCPDCRSINLLLRHIVSINEFNGDSANIFATINKSCGTRCCCCFRPHMEVVLSNSKPLGRFRDPCTCCNYNTEIYDSYGNLRYTVIGDCCQTGFCGGSASKKFASIRFDITQNGQIVGMIKKLAASSFGEFFTKADSYQVFFPSNATPEEKMMFIIAGIMLDYQFFEEKK